MRIFQITLSIAMILLIGCNTGTETKSIESSSIAMNEESDELSEAYSLFYTNCYACHSVSSASHDEILAPPMAAVKWRYMRSYKTEESFVNAIVEWGKNPHIEKALMRAAVDQFEVMPKQVFDEEELRKIATYIYQNEIEKPVWFQTHFEEQHGNPGN